jgi:hypothetical protein
MRGSGVLLIAVVLVAGCGPITRNVVRSSIDEEAQRDNWDKLRTPLRQLAGEVAKGVIDAGTSSQIASSLDASIDRFVRTVLHAAAEGLGAEVSPAMARTVRATVDEVLAAILSDGTRRGAAEIADALTAAAMTGLARGIRDQLAPAFATALDANLGPAMQRMIEHNLGPAIAKALQADLGPALAKTLQNDLGPAFAATLKTDLTPALEDAARRTSTAAGQGFIDGIDRSAGPLVAKQLDRLHDLADRADHDVYAIALVMLLAIVACGLGLALWRHHRIADTHHEALHLVTSQIRRMSAEPAVRDLVQQIKTAGEGRQAGALLDDHLPVQPSSKS